MEITIRHTEGCPNAGLAAERLDEALRVAGVPHARISRQLVASSEEAERLEFVGSPTILIGGSDPFLPQGARPALACRVYDTAKGREGAPSVDQLVAALKGVQQGD